MAGVLPEVVRRRADKTALGSFLDFGLREKEVHQVERLLAAPLAAELGIVDGPRLRAAYRLYRKTQPDGAKRLLWYALTLETWLQHVGGELDLRSGERPSGAETTTVGFAA